MTACCHDGPLLCCWRPADVSHHPGSEDSLLKSSSSGAATGWFLITYRDTERPNSEVRVAPLTEPTKQTVGSHELCAKACKGPACRNIKILMQGKTALTCIRLNPLSTSSLMPALKFDPQPSPLSPYAQTAMPGLACPKHLRCLQTGAL